MAPARAQTRTTCSEVERTNNAATAFVVKEEIKSVIRPLTKAAEFTKIGVKTLRCHWFPFTAYLSHMISTTHDFVEN